VEITDFFSVSPSIASETVNNAVLIMVIASVAILIYITWAFRRVPSPFRYGISAIVALIHDVVVVMGVFSVAGRVFDLEVNAMFIAGVLTIIGYSVHDTIVVFDRIRENLIRGIGRDLGATINVSILDTIGRSLNTSLTLLFAILALLLFGGPTIQDFLIVLLIGIIVGTYSSIWIASQVLMVWESGDVGRLLRRLPLPFPFRRRRSATP
jgi:preprotein translocase subunit SecF